MSGSSNTGSLRLTPKNRLTPIQTPGKSTREDTGVRLSLKRVIGTTTGSANAFDSDHESHSFAVCAGSTVVLSQIDEDLNITQRFFRARPDVWPTSATCSFYSSPVAQSTSDSRSRSASSMKDGGHGQASGGITVGNYSVESPGRGKASKRTRDMTCVSLSPGAKLLAVGETGYNPRILIFSTTPDAQLDVPLSSINEHSFGVRACAFSPDSRWLCSLGNVHDGFVYLWSINPKSGSCKLQFSNKVTSFVQNIAWMGSSIITVGTRHVKVWRLEQVMPASPSKKRFDIENSLDGVTGSPMPRTFSGRNCLLGALIDATFTCVVAISNSKAILCTDKGDICLLDDTDGHQRLDRIAKTSSGILCVTVDRTNQRLWMGGIMKKLWSLPLDSLTCVKDVSDYLSSPSDPESSSSSGSSREPDALAIGSLRDQIVTVDSNHIISIKDARSSDSGSTMAIEKRMPAHDSAVLGVNILHQPNDHNAEYFTWSIRGTIIFWLLDGTCKGKLEVPLDHPDNVEEGDLNELKVVRECHSDQCFISGDKFGFLRVIDPIGRDITVLRAHNGGIHDIALARRNTGDTLVVSCGRDRTLQLFRKVGGNLTIQQTLDDHTASVCNVMFLNDGSTLLSSSSDRTIVMRTLVTGEGQEIAFIPIRVFTLKASPIAFTALPGSNVLVVSTLDRQIHKYHLSTGRLFQSFRALDYTGSDSLVISSLSIQKLEKAPNQVLILLGISSTDKSISVYDYDNGSVLVKEYGQTIASDVAYVQQYGENGDIKTFLITTGVDGTIMIWDMTVKPRFLTGPNENVKGENTAEPLKTHMSAFSHPLRRILTKSEIQDFQKSLENDGDPPTPSRSHSPSRIRKKASKYTLANTPKVAIPAVPGNTHHSPSSSLATEASNRKNSHNHSSTAPSPKNTKASVRCRLPSLDGRHRRKSTGNLNDLDIAAEQMCKSLRVYRKKINSSTELLKRDNAEELERELKLTVDAITERTAKTQAVNEMISGDLLDAYLAKMIDQRLAFLNKPEDSGNSRTGAKESESPPKSLGEGYLT